MRSRVVAAARDIFEVLGCEAMGNVTVTIRGTNIDLTFVIQPAELLDDTAQAGPEELTAYQRTILAVFAEGESYTVEKIARLAKVKVNSHLRTNLAILVRAGCLTKGSDGYEMCPAD